MTKMMLLPTEERRVRESCTVRARGATIVLALQADDDDDEGIWRSNFSVRVYKDGDQLVNHSGLRRPTAWAEIMEYVRRAVYEKLP